MKLTKLSLAAIMALGFTSAAMADVDVQFGGQAVLYYQTWDKDAQGSPDMFNKEASQGNVGLEISAKADLGNDFQAGITADIIGTAGLESNLVSGVMEAAVSPGDVVAGTEDLDGYWLAEAYVAKTIGNTTLKIGRQYLNTPLAFSEGWNVFKNSFEAAVLVNKDLPDTTIVLAMVNKANQIGHSMDQFVSGVTLANNNLDEDEAVYALGIINNSIENLSLDIWGYNVAQDGTAVWADASYKLDAGEFPLTVALQGANIDPSGANTNDTDMWGIKLGTKVQGWGLSAAYNSVDDGDYDVTEIAGVKTKLFVQQILNQNSISQDADTWQLKVVTPAYQGFKLIAQYASTDAGDKNGVLDDNGKGSDLDELDLIVKGKVLGTNLLVAYVNQEFDGAYTSTTTRDKSLFRVVARYKF